MSVDLQQFRAMFFEESSEQVAELESGLLELEQTPDSSDVINRIFRAAHSLKGASASLGMTDIANFTHAMEGLLDQMRSGKIQATRERIDVLLRARDTLVELIAAEQSQRPANVDMQPVIVLLEKAKGDGKEGASSVASQKKSAGEATSVPGVERSYRVHYAPTADALARGLDPLLPLRELATLGKLTLLKFDRSKVPELASLRPNSFALSWTLECTTTEPRARIDDVFAFVEGNAELEISEAPSASSMAIAGAKGADGARRQGADGRGADRVESASIRVATDKVDKLVNLVGEIVIVQSMIQQATENFTMERLMGLQESVKVMERNLRELQERVMAIRMLPIATTFQRYPRMVRDLATSLGKDIELVLEGEDTELDKSVIEKLSDPLTHLVRNSVDHGVETPDIRASKGKSPRGKIRLSARHQGGNLVIEITDDGRGIDPDAIRKKATALGILSSGEDWTTERLQELIFRPGFSTASQVTDVSGRGVGLDVVKRGIESLGGVLHLTSEVGVGTRFLVKLPLTLAILDGQCLVASGQTYVVPLMAIIECLHLEPREIQTILGRGRVAVVRGETLPLLRFEAAFDPMTQKPIREDGRQLVVVLDADGQKVGLCVDELLGQHQVVIKNLEGNFRRVEGVMGATIMGDGQVALVIDVPELRKIAQTDTASVAMGGLDPARLAAQKVSAPAVEA